MMSSIPIENQEQYIMEKNNIFFITWKSNQEDGNVGPFFLCGDAQYMHGGILVIYVPTLVNLKK